MKVPFGKFLFSMLAKENVLSRFLLFGLCTILGSAGFSNELLPTASRLTFFFFLFFEFPVFKFKFKFSVFPFPESWTILGSDLDSLFLSLEGLSKLIFYFSLYLEVR